MHFVVAQKSKVRSAVEHVFAHQKGLMGLIVRTIGQPVSGEPR
jgi:IS5 family transposase